MEKPDITHANGEAALSRQLTLQLSPKQYEELFFQPTAPRRGDFAKRFGNPTILGILGFSIPFTTTVLSFLQFQGANDTSVIGVSGSYYFVGGIAMCLAGIFEFILGNTFPFALFIIYGCHFCNLGYTYDPLINLAAAYGANGSSTTPFTSGQGLYNVAMSITSFVLFLGSVRTNLPLSTAIFCLIFFFSLVSAAEFKLGHVNSPLDMKAAQTYMKVGAGFGFVTMLSGWYLAIALALASTDVPVHLPVFDLSSKFSRARKDTATEIDQEKND